MKDTVFSPYRRYRYTLWREWMGGEGYAMFIGLNPSTADEVQNDPTVRRCINYAKDWGFGGMFMMNIFAFRATDPRVMKAEPEPVGSENDHYLDLIARDAGVIVAAWGTHGEHLGRGKQVQAMLGEKLHCLKLTGEGYPAHSLYLKKDLRPAPMNNREVSMIIAAEVMSK